MKDQKIIFVIGTGRSGTHWIGYILQSHPEIHVSIEKPEIFHLATSMALNPKIKKTLFPQLVNIYKKQQVKAFPKHYADKSHPNLWHVEDLANEFPQSKFIGIYRNPYATIASMLKHSGVLEWYNKLNHFPIPNKFLGITHENIKEFEKMSLPAKCALRWQSHKNELDELKKKFKDRVLVISYENLIKQHKTETNRLKNFLNLSEDFPPIEIKDESLDKWKKDLSLKICNEIKEVLGQGPEDIN